MQEQDRPGQQERVKRMSLSEFLERDTIADRESQPRTEATSGTTADSPDKGEQFRRPGDPARLLLDYPPGSHRFGTLRFLTSAIKARRPTDIVAKPDMISLPEWWAVHAVLFYNHASILYGLVIEACGCRRMTGGRQAEYLYSDGRRKELPHSVPAAVYIEALFGWMETLLEDARYFPKRDFAGYPEDFEKMYRSFVKRVFRIFAHLNYAHREHLRGAARDHQQGSGEELLDCILMHLLVFVKHFKLMEKKEFEVLKKRYELYTKDKKGSNGGANKRKEREEKDF